MAPYDPDDPEFDPDDPDYDPDKQENSKTQRTPGEWAELRKAKAKLKVLEREAAFRKAGIDPDDPKMKFFVKGYEGKLEADEIKASAIEHGFLAKDKPEGDGKEPKADESKADEGKDDGPKLDADGKPIPDIGEEQERIAKAAAGALSDDPTEAAGLAAMDEAFAKGGLPELQRVAAELGVPWAKED